MKSRIKAIANKCSGCGNDMVFNPDFGCIVCPACSNKKEIISSSSIKKHDLNKANSTTNNNAEWASQIKSMSCPNCGAKIILNNYQASSKCPYCTSSLIASMENFSGTKPDAIIPFAFSKEKAVNVFKENIVNKAFISKSFKNNINTNEIQGYYFPVFMFDAECSTIFNGRLYENYEVKDKDGNTETKRKYFDISGHKITRHNDIEVEASTKLSQFEMNFIKPFDKQLLKSYTDDYVYGFELEHYNNSIADCYLQAQQIMKSEIKNSILFNYKYDGIDSFDMINTFENPKYSYVFYPMYRINYTHKNNNYSNIMNGQTGKIYGDYPKSTAKIILAVLGGLLGFLAVLAIPALFILLAFL